MAKKDDRFIKVLDEGSAFGWQRTIWVDRLTGVNYLWVASGYAGGPDPAARRRRQARRDPDPIRRGMTPLLLRS